MQVVLRLERFFRDLHFQERADDGVINCRGRFNGKEPSPFPAQRICGHVGMHVFHYTGRKGQAEENRYAANSLCPECAGVIRVWFEQSEPGFYKVDLPKLVSRSPNLISWGNRVRIAQLRKLGPVMKRMASESESDLLAALTLQVLTMMFKIDSASFGSTLISTPMALTHLAGISRRSFEDEKHQQIRWARHQCLGIGWLEMSVLRTTRSKLRRCSNPF